LTRYFRITSSFNLKKKVSERNALGVAGSAGTIEEDGIRAQEVISQRRFENSPSATAYECERDTKKEWNT
jgi:hypothetical protein